MATRNEMTLTSASGSLVVGTMNNADKAYTPAYLRNRITHRREEVILFDPLDEGSAEKRLLSACKSNYELHCDLTAAFKSFSPIEKRIILRVLLQGLSVEEACQRMRKSARTWERWMYTKALPVLRVVLSDYEEDLAQLGVCLPAESSFEEQGEEEPVKALVCKKCGAVETSMPSLRSHWRAEHPAEAKSIAHFVASKDRDNARLAEQMVEPKIANETSEDE